MSIIICSYLWLVPSAADEMPEATDSQQLWHCTETANATSFRQKCTLDCTPGWQSTGALQKMNF